MDIVKPYIKCAFSYILSDIYDNKVLIVITGDQSIMDDVDDIQEISDDKKVPIFFISCSGTHYAPNLDPTEDVVRFNQERSEQVLELHWMFQMKTK